MKINMFLLGFGIGGLLASYLYENFYPEASKTELELQEKVIKMQRGVIHTFYEELHKVYEKLEELESRVNTNSL